MAKIDIKAIISAPLEINIPLVRADHAATANIFRIFFEIFLSLFSAQLGYVLSLANPERFHWIALSICGVATASFLAISVRVARRRD